jgi:hypothetical protein
MDYAKQEGCICVYSADGRQIGCFCIEDSGLGRTIYLGVYSEARTRFFVTTISHLIHYEKEIGYERGYPLAWEENLKRNVKYVSSQIKFASAVENETGVRLRNGGDPLSFLLLYWSCAESFLTSRGVDIPIDSYDLDRNPISDKEKMQEVIYSCKTKGDPMNFKAFLQDKCLWEPDILDRIGIDEESLSQYQAKPIYEVESEDDQIKEAIVLVVRGEKRSLPLEKLKRGHKTPKIAKHICQEIINAIEEIEGKDTVPTCPRIQEKVHQYYESAIIYSETHIKAYLGSLVNAGIVENRRPGYYLL